jgi:hypothetical protein
MIIKGGYEANDTICVADSNDGGNLKCSVNRRFIVIDSVQYFIPLGTDGFIGISRARS